MELSYTLVHVSPSNNALRRSGAYNSILKRTRKNIGISAKLQCDLILDRSKYIQDMVSASCHIGTP